MLVGQDASATVFEKLAVRVGVSLRFARRVSASQASILATATGVSYPFFERALVFDIVRSFVVEVHAIGHLNSPGCFSQTASGLRPFEFGDPSTDNRVYHYRSNHLAAPCGPRIGRSVLIFRARHTAFPKKQIYEFHPVRELKCNRANPRPPDCHLKTYFGRNRFGLPEAQKKSRQLACTRRRHIEKLLFESLVITAGGASGPFEAGRHPRSCPQ